MSRVASKASCAKYYGKCVPFDKYMNDWHDWRSEAKWLRKLRRRQQAAGFLVLNDAL